MEKSVKQLRDIQPLMRNNEVWRAVDFSALLTDDLSLPIRLTDDQSGIHAISPDEENASATVYTITGMPVSGNTSSLPKGIYVKRQGNSVKKVLVK